MYARIDGSHIPEVVSSACVNALLCCPKDRLYMWHVMHSNIRKEKYNNCVKQIMYKLSVCVCVCVCWASCLGSRLI